MTDLSVAAPRCVGTGLREQVFAWRQKGRTCRVIRRIDASLLGRRNVPTVRIELSHREYCRLFLLDLPWIVRKTLLMFGGCRYVERRRRFNAEMEEALQIHYESLGWRFIVSGGCAIIMRNLRFR